MHACKHSMFPDMVSNKILVQLSAGENRDQYTAFVDSF